MDGSIVKVHCLAGEPTKLGMAAMGMAQRTPKSSKPVAGAGQATGAGAAAGGAAGAAAGEASTSSGSAPQAAGAKAAPVGLLAPGSVAALLQAGHVTAAAPPEGCAAAALRVEQNGDGSGKRHAVEDLAGLGDIAQLAKKIKMEPT